jgi:cyclopropane fatty-acyl-phospholipid synthase-like methyltransferase
MLEAKFGPFFRDNVLPKIDVFEKIDEASGRVLDLGCGNGWYLRELAANYDDLTGLGIDAIADGIDQANEAASEQGLAERLEFRCTDIFEFQPDVPFDAIVLNRTLHHLWGRRDDLLEVVDACLADDGSLLVWEPAYPAERTELRNPRKQMLGMRNLAEHAMQNRLLEPDEVRQTLAELDLEVDVHQIDEVETLFVGRR